MCAVTDLTSEHKHCITWAFLDEKILLKAVDAKQRGNPDQLYIKSEKVSNLRTAVFINFVVSKGLQFLKLQTFEFNWIV